MKRTFEYSITVIVDGPNEVPSEDAIDHAQTTLREFEDETPDIPGTTAYTAPTDRQRNRWGQYVTGDGVRDHLGRFTNERTPQEYNGGRPPETTGHCSRCGQPGRNRLTCLARFSRTRSGMKHRKRGNGRSYRTPKKYSMLHSPHYQWTDRHHRAH